MVTILGVGEADCIWCGKQKECLEVTTDDHSFVGALCFPDLKRMLRLKSTSNGQVKPKVTAER